VSVRDEFATVELLLESDAETRGVDAFALSLIKAEKQARRLITYLVYQCSWCCHSTVRALKDELWSNKKVYFPGLLAGWNALYPVSVEQLVGAEYSRLRDRLEEGRRFRNKIFHGQLTNKRLSRPELVNLVQDIREWCDGLGHGAEVEVGYDGCGRNSFRKAVNHDELQLKYKVQLQDIEDYKRFIAGHMTGH
jgi:hypothetical protein